MDVELIDIGCNLTHDSFAGDRGEVLRRAREAGVTRQIITGANLASSTAAAGLAADDAQGLWSTAGVHPHNAFEFSTEVRDGLRHLLEQRRVVAVGECGLDYCRNHSPPDAQRSAFIAQLELAASLGKPVFLHQRDSHADFTAILQDYRGRVRGIAHCFTGDRAQLEDYLQLGLSVGVTGWVCDERRGSDLRSAVAVIPAGRLMIETDAPYLLPRDLQPRPKSRRNEPAHLLHIARSVAELRGESLESIAMTTTRNAMALFDLV